MLKALSRKPADRYANATSFAEALQDALLAHDIELIEPASAVKSSYVKFRTSQPLAKSANGSSGWVIGRAREHLVGWTATQSHGAAGGASLLAPPRESATLAAREPAARRRRGWRRSRAQDSDLCAHRRAGGPHRLRGRRLCDRRLPSWRWCHDCAEHGDRDPERSTHRDAGPNHDHRPRHAHLDARADEDAKPGTTATNTHALRRRTRRSTRRPLQLLSTNCEARHCANEQPSSSH